jgi:high-affinity iron transporter
MMLTATYPTILPAAVIVFREVLEVALVLSLLRAAPRGVVGSQRWLLLGVCGGVLGAIVVALLGEQIGNAFAGIGQELLNAMVLALTALMLGWHQLWISRHGRALGQQIQQVGQAVAGGKKPLWALATMAGLATLREGAEVVLFLFGLAAQSQGAAGLPAMAIGSGLGLLAGGVLGYILYRSLLRLPIQWFFRVTGWMILLIAAGMAGKSVVFLQQAGWLPYMTNSLWDVSAWLPEDGALGQVLGVLVGYTANPSGMQLLVYGMTVLVIYGGQYCLAGGARPKSAKVHHHAA